MRLGAPYAALAPYPKSVVSGPGRATANREAMAKLFDRGSKGSRMIVCVDLLGEGFDLPYLKIAALHDSHKTNSFLRPECWHPDSRVQ